MRKSRQGQIYNILTTQDVEYYYYHKPVAQHLRPKSDESEPVVSRRLAHNGNFDFYTLLYKQLLVKLLVTIS